MKLLIVLFIWTGCLLPYLASSRQQLIPKKLPKLAAWLAFTVLQVIASWGLSYFYQPMAACLIVLMLVMCMWIVITIISSHLSSRLLLVCSIAVVFFSMITLTGVGHVA